MFRMALIAALLSLGGMVPDVASGSMIGFTVQLHTNQDHFSITNDSDIGFSITDMDVFLGSDTEFDASLLNLGTLTDPGADLTFSPALATAVVDGASTASFGFAGFDSGDVFQFNVRFRDGSGNVAAGSDLDNALIAVKFSDGHSLLTTFTGGPTSPPTSNKQSFMFSASAVTVPAPSSMILAMLGIVGLGLIRGGTRIKQVKQGFGEF